MERQGRRFADDIEATKVIEKLQKQPKQKEKPNIIKNKPEKEKKPKKEKTPSEKELLRERKKREKQLEKDHS